MKTSLQTSLPPNNNMCRDVGGTLLLWSTFRRAAVWGSSTAAAFLVLYGLWQFYDANWPKPSFSIGAPSFGSPFDIPFDVINSSEFFDMYDIRLECVLLGPNISTRYVKNMRIDDTVLATEYVSNLGAGEARSYTCPFASTIGLMLNSEYTVLSARIQFELPGLLWENIT